jgi:cytochrome c-type biogenesis protein CcmF
MGILFAAWIAATAGTALAQRLAPRPGETLSLPARIRRVGTSFLGMTVAHLGVAVFVVGVTMVKGYETEQDVRMRVGETVLSGGYTFRFDGTRDVEGPNFRAVQGQFTVLREGRVIETLTPEKRVYNASGMVMTEASIDSGFTRDLYVSLGEPVEGDAWVVRVYHKPFIDWIWAGCFLMALGGLLAVCDRRYRVRVRRRSGTTEAGDTTAAQPLAPALPETPGLGHAGRAP